MSQAQRYPRMSRCHFQFIAGTVKVLPETIRLRVALEFAAELAGTNPNFRRETFLAACGVQS